MSREIKFRGRDIISGDWVYGDLIHGVGAKHGRIYILPIQINLARVKNCHYLDGVEVDPETVCQLIVLHDKNEKEIYDGDIILDLITKAVYLVKVGFCKKYGFTGVYGEDRDGRQVQINNDADENHNSNISKIGNIFENPELLNP